MAKLQAPLFSFSAKKTLSAALSFARRNATNIAYHKPRSTDRKSPAQLFQRNMYQQCSTLWHTLTPDQKALWTAAARLHPITPFAMFMSDCLKPNPGIYLPLSGGTMTGDIDMDNSRILTLLDPILNQEPATKKYVDDTAAGESGEGHITILPNSYSSIGQGTWAFALDANQWLYGTFYNSTTNDGDNLSFQLYLDAATYTLLLFCIRGPNRAIIDFDIDATEVASFDMYSAAGVYNATFKKTAIVIPSSGLKTLTARVDGKHASSSNHVATLSYIALWRTA